MEDQQKRLFIALLLCTGIVLAYPSLFPPPQPAPPAQPTQQTQEQPAEQPPAQQVVQATDGSGAAMTASVAEGTGQAAVIETRTPSVPEAEILPPQTLFSSYGEEGDEFAFSLSLSNRGGSIAAVEINRPEQYVPEEDSIFPHEAYPEGPYALTVSAIPELSLTSGFEFVAEESLVHEGLNGETLYSKVTYRWTNGVVTVDKVYEVDPERPYTTNLDVTVHNNGATPINLGTLEFFMLTDNTTGEEGGVFNPIANTRQTACMVGDDVHEEGEGDLSAPPAEEHRHAGAVQWAGVQDRYFLVGLSPRGETIAAGCRLGKIVHTGANQQGVEQLSTYLATTLIVEGGDVDPGGAATFTLAAYTGPKDSNALAVAGSNLGRSINFGMFSFLAYPMRWILKTLFSVVGNWGIAIILLTLIVKGAMFPWTQKSFKSMERMKQIQPKLTKLREKYKNDKTKMTEETMKLYREHNVSPFGCLPMLLQMPIYLALYRTIYNSVELYNAEFMLWITDLSARDPYYILPVLMSVTMVGQQLLSPTATDNPQMKWVMRTMPIMFGIFMLVLPSGLVLYIFVSSLLGILQQWHIRRQFAAEKKEDTLALATAPEKQTRQQRRQAARRQQS